MATIKGMVRKQESHVSMDASGKRVPKAPEVPWKIPDTYEIKQLSAVLTRSSKGCMCLICRLQTVSLSGMGTALLQGATTRSWCITM